MGVWDRILMALVVPVAWGLLTAWFFDRLRARQECNSARAAATEPPPGAPPEVPS